MMNRKNAGIVALMGAALLLSTQANAASITEGFEGSSYDLFTSGGGSAGLSTTTVHTGSQSLDLSLTTGTDYARVKLSESGLTLGAISGADYWVDRTSGTAANPNKAPYILLSISCPGCGSDGTLAVMWNPPDIGIYPPLNTWTDIVIDPNTTLFHVEGDTTGLATPTTMTLASLSSSLYSPGVTWGNFAVEFVRIGFGQEGPDGIPGNYFVDDLTINTANATPLPAALPLFATGLGAFGLLGWRRKRKAAAITA
jgi:hypothetical protein